MFRNRSINLVSAAFMAAACGSLTAQVNDHCAGAIPAGPGTTFGTNAGATTGPEPTGGCGMALGDVWYVFVAPCNGPWAASTCSAATDFDTVITIWDGTNGCGALAGILCNNDFCGPPFSPSNSYVTFQSVAGTTYYVSVAGHAGAQGSFSLTFAAIGTELHFFSTGPGTIGYQVDGGPQNGTVFTAITLASQFYPYGWFHGIDITLDELIGEYQQGFPFVATAGPVCGDVTVGPFSGLPSGIALFGVTVGIPVGSSFPHPVFISPPDLAIIP